MREDSSLKDRLVEKIRRQGPIGIDTFMGYCLSHPEQGYYRTRDPLGAAGDFITAPEISQIFGEIIGAWCLDIWQRMGSPSPFRLIELGPGRGSLMADMLRVFRLVPAAASAVDIHLVEISQPLRALQAGTLTARHPHHKIHWHEELGTIPPGPAILIANEFFDALPIRQWIRRGATWHERVIALDERDTLVFAEQARDQPPYVPEDAAEGDIFESASAAQRVAETIGRRLGDEAGAALIIDYGYPRTHAGDTLQALHKHRYVPVLDHPGEADLTAHVDFATLGRSFTKVGAAVSDLVTQGDFLLALGAAHRAQRLMAGKPDDEAALILTGLRRLIHPGQMGTLFKVLGAASPRLGNLPGFATGPVESALP